MWFRNLAFNLGIFRSKIFPVKTISVGNIRVGGTGKTPLIAHLIRGLKEENNIAVLSRGYGRTTSGFYWVHTFDEATKVGDEPLMLKQAFEGVLVAVCESRRAGIEQILYEQPMVSLILLDDAFQHRWVKSSLSILLTSYDRPFFKDFPFPAGMLREFRMGYKRADAVVVSKCPADFDPKSFKKYIKKKPLFFSQLDYVHLDKQEIYGFCGLAESDLFKQHLEEKYHLKGFRKYKDHYDYTQEDLDELISLAGMSRLVCTRKDMVKMENFRGSERIEVLDVGMSFSPEDALIKWINEHLN